jgi:Spy/CpxP family protein refolding chaperone
MQAATERLHEKVNAILTAEQRALIEKINAARAAAVEEVGIVYKDKFGTIKADEAARRRVMEEKNLDIVDNFLAKLDAILTPSQKEALARAAAEEEQRMKNAGNKKPQKP